MISREAYLHRPQDLGEVTRAVLEFGAGFSLPDYVEANFRREAISRDYASFFERSGAAVLLTPTLGCQAFGHGQVWPERIEGRTIELPWVDWASFLYDANLTGSPACALPMGLGDEGLPLSLQVAGRRGDDALVLAVAEQIEGVLADGAPRRPPID